MKRVLTMLAGSAIVAAGLGMGTVIAQDAGEPQVDRQTMMGQVGAVTRGLGLMARGEAEYNAAEAVAGMRLYRAVAAGYPYLFPEGSEEGFESRAAPTIWSDRTGFVAAAQKMEDDATAAIETAGTGLEAFRAAFGQVASNCQACHETYRLPDN